MKVKRRRNKLHGKVYTTYYFRNKYQRVFYKVLNELKKYNTIGIIQLKEVIKEKLVEEGLPPSNKSIGYILGFFRRNHVLEPVPGFMIFRVNLKR